MQEEQSKYSIIFKELDRLAEEPKILIMDDDLIEFEEIRILREIALDIQTPSRAYFTST